MLVKFIECMLYTNHCHETPVHQIPTVHWYVNIILEDGTVMPEWYEIAAEEYCCVRLTHLVPLIQIVLSSLVYDVTLYLNQF